MKSVILSLAVALASVTPALSVAVWGQCGGIGYTGSTTCDSGSGCVKLNDYYSQCQPGASTSSTPTSTTTASSPTSSNAVCPGAKTKFKFFGASESCAEFGNQNIPGVLGTDYTWPSPSSIDYLMGQGFNTFRIPFLMERLSPPSTGMTGAFDQTYLSGLKTIVSYVTGKGGYAAIDPHNYMRYNGAIITSTSTFQSWWQKLATEFVSNDHVIFDLQNEPYDIDASVVAQLMQAGINGVRASGAKQMIFVEGTSWTGAWTWTTSGNSNAFTNLTDPANNFAIEMHQYLDSDGSGTSATCVSSTIGGERLQNATAWLQQNNLKGVLGEIGAGSNSVCVSAVQSALCEMQSSNVWLGALWWAAGPWWGDYFQSIEPPSGDAISMILPQALKPFM